MDNRPGSGAPIIAFPRWQRERDEPSQSGERRDQFVASLCQELFPDKRLVIPFTPISTEELHELLEAQHLTEEDVWVYGSQAPAALLPRLNNKVQVHLPMCEGDVPEWYDLEFPRRIEQVTLPGYSCFSTPAFGVACEKLLEQYASVRIKDPTAFLGYGQTVVASPEDLVCLKAEYHRRFGVELAEALQIHGLVVEANLTDVDAWSVTVTHTPAGAFTTLGRVVAEKVDLPGGGHEDWYAGTSGVVVNGGIESLSKIPDRGIAVEDPVRGETYNIHADQGIVAAADQYFAGMSAWRSEGISGSRINLDILRGQLRMRDGDTRVIAGVLEETQRMGGASALELAGFQQLQRTPGAKYALRSLRVAFTRETAQAYEAHIAAAKHGVVLWNGYDASKGRYVLCGMF